MAESEGAPFSTFWFALEHRLWSHHAVLTSKAERIARYRCHAIRPGSRWEWCFNGISNNLKKRRGQLPIKLYVIFSFYAELSFLAGWCSGYTLASSKRELRVVGWLLGQNQVSEKHDSSGLKSAAPDAPICVVKPAIDKLQLRDLTNWPILTTHS